MGRSGGTNAENEKECGVVTERFRDRLLKFRNAEFEYGMGGLALAVLFIGPMWMDFLHNNFPGRSVVWQAVIGFVCTVAAVVVLGRMLYVLWRR